LAGLRVMTPSGTLPIVMKSERKTPNRPIRSATGVLWGLHKDFDIYNWCPVGSSDIDNRFVERDESPHPQKLSHWHSHSL